MLFLSLISLAILTQCDQDSSLLFTQSIKKVDNSALVTTTITEEDCTTCPKLEALSLKYFDETASSQPKGHFLFDLGLQNEQTQYNAIPSKIDVYNYTEANEVVNITTESGFEQVLTMAGIPLDTIINLLPLTHYTKRFKDILNTSVGAFASPCRTCDTLYQWPDINYFTTSDQKCISPDSLSYCLSGKDICTMLDIADSVTFSFYPQVYTPGVSLGGRPQKEELVFQDAFLKVLFDKRFVNGDIDFNAITELDTSLTLSDCPIFSSNDNTIPSMFSMAYNFTNKLFNLEVHWADNSLMQEILITLWDIPRVNDSEDSFTIRAILNEPSNTFKVENFTQIAEFLSDEEILNISIRLLATDGTINVVEFGLTSNECLDR